MSQLEGVKKEELGSTERVQSGPQPGQGSVARASSGTGRRKRRRDSREHEAGPAGEPEKKQKKGARFASKNLSRLIWKTGRKSQKVQTKQGGRGRRLEIHQVP